MAPLIAITGTTGFIGGHVASLLRDKGFALRALARDASRLPAGIEPLQGDLSAPEPLDRLCTGAVAVVHLAGTVTAPDRESFFRINEAGTQAMAAAAARASIGRFIHVSSLAAREPQLSAYAASKRAGEAAARAGLGAAGLAILRPPAVYGPGDRATLPLIAQLTRRVAILPARRDSRFSLLHVGDLARLIASLVASEWSGLAEIDDGQTGGYRWRDLLRIAAEAEEHPIAPVFLPRVVVAGLAQIVPLAGITQGKVRELYHADWVARGPQPPLADRVGFAQGFRDTVAWYRERGWLPPARPRDKRRRMERGETAA